MRVMIWCDMEGVAGIQSWEQVGEPVGPRYEEGRRLYTHEVNAAVRGAKRAGADEIIVIDGHGGGYPFMSFINEELEPGAEYVQGYRWARYVAPMEDGKCDAALFVGAHAMAGTPDGVLCHTVSTESWHNADINGTLVGESGIIAAVVGSFGVPCIFVAGDTATCREVVELLGPEVVAVPVKEGLTPFSARNLVPSEARRRIEEGVYQAISERNWPKPLVFPAPVTFRVELVSPNDARNYRGREGVEITGPREVRASGQTFYEAWDKFWYRV
jgi:D-amino peptidase